MKILNNMLVKKIFISGLLISFLATTSCDNDFGDINKSYKANLYEANVPGLFAGITQSLQYGVTEYRLPVSWLYQWNQQAAMYSASGYRLDDHTTDAWKNYYTALANYNDLVDLIGNDEHPEKMTNVLEMANVLMAYKTLYATLLYGDMPYFDAGKGFLSSAGFRPAYNAQQAIMEDAINKLTKAVNTLTVSTAQQSIGSADVLFGNDINKWKKFANSVRLYYAMTMREKNAAFADPIIADALNKPLLTADENVMLDPAVTTILNDREGYFRGNSYIRMGSTMFNAMSSTNAVDGSGIFDLRCNIIFEANENDEWVPYPQVPNSSTPAVTGDPDTPDRLTNWNVNRSNFAAFNVYYVQDKTIPQFVITGSQVSFLKAEIYNRGIAGIAANPTMAKTFYEDGIKASVKFWYKQAYNSIWVVNKPATETPDATALNNMLTNPDVAYSATPATALAQIYKQSWVALIHQPIEAWTLQRRTGNATPNEPLPSSSLVTDFNRLTYPPSERETNRENWTAATGGTDSEKKKIWVQP